MTDPERPSARAMLARALARHCPRCASGGLFRGWFHMVATCPRCGLRFEREEGAFLGSLTLNYAFSGVLGVIVMVVWFALTLPDTDIVPMMVAVIGVVLAGVPLFYPVAKTTWTAIDLIMRSDERGEPPQSSRA